MVPDLVRWLHLSDFHVGKDVFAQEQIFDLILDCLKRKMETNLAPHLIVITGDIANKGKEEEYKTFDEKFLNKLKSVLATNSPAEIIMVPGNHDIERQEDEGPWPHDLFPERIPRLFDPTFDGKQSRSKLFSRFMNFTKFDDSGKKKGQVGS